MATEQKTPNRKTQGDMIHCDFCGETYSATYRRCPFCDEVARPTARKAAAPSSKKADAPIGKPIASSGGRRPPSRNARGGGYGRTTRLNQIIFLVVTLSLIISACVVLGKVIVPLISREPAETKPTTTTAADSTQAPTQTTAPIVTAPPTIPTLISNLKLSSSDVTLKANESFTLTPTITPSDADVDVVWSVDQPNVVTVTDGGIVMNINGGNTTILTNVTATVGDVSSSCIVRCKGSGAGTSTPQTTTPSAGGDSDDATGSATVVGATSGLNVRSQPSTSATVIASLTTGNKVTVLESADADWYKISFKNTSGVMETGYCAKAFIDVN